MSHSPFPADLLYEVIDLLRDRRNTLKSCCLVSKSWIPIARKHLFAKVEFRTWKSLQLWKAAFPDASTSPLCYVKTLLVTHYAVRLADADRIPTFPRVVNLHLNLVGAGSEVHPSPLARPESAVSLVPLHGFSPALRSLGVTFSPHPASPIFDLAYSFPLLEDLSVVTDYWFSGDDGFDRQETAVQPSDPPALTGSLELSAVGGMDPIASRLLSIPSGLKFRELKLLWNREGDILSTIELVEKCSSTLESLRIQSKLNGEPSELLDLSKALNLQRASFVCKLNPRWIVETLQTITSDNQALQQISIETPTLPYNSGLHNFDPLNPGHAVGESAHSWWSKLDYLLTKLHKSHQVRLKILYNVPVWADKQRARVCMESLLPEVTKRNIVDLVHRRKEW